MVIPLHPLRFDTPALWLFLHTVLIFSPTHTHFELIHTTMLSRLDHGLKALSIAASAGTIGVGIAAGMDSIGGEDMSTLADKHYHVYMPASFTFWIWWPIYAGLLAYLGFEVWNRDKLVLSRMSTFGYVVASCLNISWLFVWSHGYVAASVGIIISLAAVLAVVSHMVVSGEEGTKNRSYVDTRLVGIPNWPDLHLFDVASLLEMYSLWVTYAAVLNTYVLIHDHTSRESEYFITAAGLGLVFVFALVVYLCAVNNRMLGLAVSLWLAIGITVRGHDDGPYDARAYYYTLILIVVMGLVKMAYTVRNAVMRRRGYVPPSTGA